LIGVVEPTALATGQVVVLDGLWGALVWNPRVSWSMVLAPQGKEARATAGIPRVVAVEKRAAGVAQVVQRDW
jgi:hypothetical protein